MDYRFQKFTTIYPIVTQRLLSRLPNYQQLSYRDLYDAVAGLYFAWSDYYVRHMRGFGHEAENVFADVEPLQKAWAKEHGVKWSSGNWLREIALARVREFQPQVIFLEDLYVFDAEFRRELRAACRSQVLLLGYRAAPTEDFAAFSDMDLLLTCVPNFAERLARSGASVAILRHAFEPSIISALGPLPVRDLEFTFTGQLVLQDGYHQRRRAIVEALLQSTPLQMWVQVGDPPPTGVARVAAGLTRRAGRVLQRMGAPALSERVSPLGRGMGQLTKSYAATLERRFPDRSHPSVFGLDNFRILARSHITFNNHIDAAEGHAGNMRLFEATGMGACLLTDWKTDLQDIFEIDKEVVAYKTAEDCVEKVKYLLSHEKERQEIAAAGQRRTLHDHTFAQRAAQLDEMIGDLLTGGMRSDVDYSLPLHR